MWSDVMLVRFFNDLASLRTNSVVVAEDERAEAAESAELIDQCPMPLREGRERSNVELFWAPSSKLRNALQGIEF